MADLSTAADIRTQIVSNRAYLEQRQDLPKETRARVEAAIALREKDLAAAEAREAAAG